MCTGIEAVFLATGSSENWVANIKLRFSCLQKDLRMWRVAYGDLKSKVIHRGEEREQYDIHKIYAKKQKVLVRLLNLQEMNC